MGPLIVRRIDQPRLPPHGSRVSTTHVLTYVERGCVRIDQGGVLDATAGTVVVAPAGVSHRALGGEDLTVHVVGFVPTAHGLDEGQPLMSPFAQVRYGALPRVCLPRARRPRLQQLLHDMRSEATVTAPESRSLLRAQLHLLLGEVTRAMPRSALPAASLSSRALTFIQRRALEPIGLAEVATAVHRSPRHVATVVKRETGFTVGEWIATTRLAEAASRLQHTDAAVATIAETVGWSDPTHFIRRFRRRYGTTPAAFRAKHR